MNKHPLYITHTTFYLGRHKIPSNKDVVGRNFFLQTLSASIVVSIWFLLPLATIVGMIVCLFYTDNFQWLPLLYIAIIVYEKDVSNRGGRKCM